MCFKCQRKWGTLNTETLPTSRNQKFYPVIFVCQNCLRYFMMSDWLFYIYHVKKCRFIFLLLVCMHGTAVTIKCNCTADLSDGPVYHCCGFILIVIKPFQDMSRVKVRGSVYSIYQITVKRHFTELSLSLLKPNNPKNEL